jgi:hypothetical protein
MTVLILKERKVKMSDFLSVFIVITQKEHNSIATMYEENRNGKFLFMWVALVK